VEETVAAPEIYRIAEAYNMPSQRIDGMNILEVHERMLEVVQHVRSGEGPYFIEAMTYRFRGHSMADPVHYRQKAEEEGWKPKGPIATYKAWLIDNDMVSEKELAHIDQEIEQEIEEAIEFADHSPFPPPEALYQDVYYQA
jgi:pyruvate dehydrogenase E1 component alpha subunit